MLDIKKLLTKMLNAQVKVKGGVTISNLSQYSPGSYYLSVSDLKTKAGLPSSATIVSITLQGWAGLGTSPGVGLQGSNGLYVLYSSGTSITSSSYVTVLIAYTL